MADYLLRKLLRCNSLSLSWYFSLKREIRKEGREWITFHNFQQQLRESIVTSPERFNGPQPCVRLCAQSAPWTPANAEVSLFVRAQTSPRSQETGIQYGDFNREWPEWWWCSTSSWSNHPETETREWAEKDTRDAQPPRSRHATTETRHMPMRKNQTELSHDLSPLFPCPSPCSIASIN